MRRPTYYRPKRRDDLRAHLLRDHARDVLALAERMTVAELTRLHDRLHAAAREALDG